MLKLGCTLPHLANICLNKSTNHKLYPFFEGDKDLCKKVREDMIGGPSIVFRRKAVVDQNFNRNSSNVCMTIVGTDDSKLYPFSICQEMPTRLYTRWEYDSETGFENLFYLKNNWEQYSMITFKNFNNGITTKILFLLLKLC